ncbi:TPA: hypothetical protein DEG21_03770 [Patescibacteria group bacterium]|nr:hypothetical protein [Candidatus Gracilibacteria bacterium]HBY74968.1 hypothetical protein [Candidatus Gracilibacteria bacterium]
MFCPFHTSLQACQLFEESRLFQFLSKVCTIFHTINLAFNHISLHKATKSEFAEKHSSSSDLSRFVI